MSHSSLTAASSCNFQQVIGNALKAYEKCTKKDLPTHPLASELHVCSSPVAILTVLQLKVAGSDQSRSSDDRRTKWIVPTVKVLYTYSTNLEERASLVSLRTWTCQRSHRYTAGIIPWENDICCSWYSSHSERPSLHSRARNITPTFHRQLRVFETKIYSSGYLSALKVIFNALRSTQKCGRPWK
jgi:hypothetical protein